MWWHLKSPAPWLFTQPFIQVQIKNLSSTSLAYVKGIHQWPVNSPHKGPVTQKIIAFGGVITLVRGAVVLLVQSLTGARYSMIQKMCTQKKHPQIDQIMPKIEFGVSVIFSYSCLSIFYFKSQTWYMILFSNINNNHQAGNLPYQTYIVQQNYILFHLWTRTLMGKSYQKTLSHFHPPINTYLYLWANKLPQHAVQPPIW